MKKLLTIFSLLFTSVALAAALNLGGSIKTNGSIGNLRIGVFLVDKNGNPNRELSSVLPNNSAFALSIADNAPPNQLIHSLSSDGLDLPGLIGDVKITGAARAAQAILRGYSDTDKNGSFNSGDKLLETTLTRGRGNMVLMYAEARFRIQGARGFDLTLESGWNLVTIELGKTIETKRVEKIDNLQLEVFASQGY